MPAFFITPQEIQGQTVTITGALHRHLRSSLRTMIGDTLVVTEEVGRRHRIRVESLDRNRLTATILETTVRPVAPPVRLRLAQAILKHDQMDWLVQKATELGVSAVLPLITRHSVVRPTPERAATQRARWERIAREAAQQSEQWEVPDILTPVDIPGWIRQEPRVQGGWLLQERSQAPSLSHVSPDPRVPVLTLVIGPEGGWAAEELPPLYHAGLQAASLGTTILRAETAALAALSIVQSRLGRFE